MVNNTPNDGILVVWLPLYLGCEIIPTKPEALQAILNFHNYDWEKPPIITKILSRILGNGLTQVEGAEHKAMRRVVQPAFTGHHIRDWAPLFFLKGSTLVRIMAGQLKDTEDGVLEVDTLISRAALDIIGAAGVGKDFNTIEGDEPLLAKLYNKVMNAPSYFMIMNVWFPLWFIRRLKGTVLADTIEAQSQLKDEVRALMQEKKALWSEEKSTTRTKDIIGGILESGDFSDEFLMSQLLTFLAAGHDTSTSALIWTLWLLSKHPQFQDQLREECHAKLSHINISKIEASAFDSDNMPFLHAVCNETLRLYPPVPATPRYSIVPTMVGNVRIPEGVTAHITPWSINRSRELWGRDASEFKPGRWLHGPHATTGGANSNYSFLTFLHGPRSCIGQGFARLEMKCLLAALITRFKFEVADPNRKIEIIGFVTIKPEGGMRLKIHDLLEENTGDREDYVGLE